MSLWRCLQDVLAHAPFCIISGSRRGCRSCGTMPSALMCMHCIAAYMLIFVGPYVLVFAYSVVRASLLQFVHGHYVYRCGVKHKVHHGIFVDGVFVLYVFGAMFVLSFTNGRVLCVCLCGDAYIRVHDTVSVLFKKSFSKKFSCRNATFHRR